MKRLAALAKTAAAAALFALASARPAAAAAPRFQDLTSGRYEIRLDGMLCHTCLRIAVDEVASLKEVEKAGGDFDQESLFVTIRPGATLKATKLQKTLRRAAKRADLGTQFEVLSVRYRVK